MPASDLTKDPVAALVRRHDPDRFLTALFAPPERRDALLTLYAFDHELARAIVVTSEPHLALIRLQWWREIVEGARRRHEVATPLAALLDEGRLPPAFLLPIIDAYETEIQPSFDSIEEWRTWLRAGAGGIVVAAAIVLGHSEPEVLRNAGVAIGIGRLIRWHAVLAKAGRCLLPADLLSDHAISRHEAIAAPGSPEMTAVMWRVAEEGADFLSKVPRRLPRAMVAAALPVVLARRDLSRWAAPQPGPRGLADRVAVIWAGLSGRL
jgi:phytoene synthase